MFGVRLSWSNDVDIIQKGDSKHFLVQVMIIELV